MNNESKNNIKLTVLILLSLLYSMAGLLISIRYEWIGLDNKYLSTSSVIALNGALVLIMVISKNTNSKASRIAMGIMYVGILAAMFAILFLVYICMNCDLKG